ncbi:hypothetical protein E2320_004542 [Naja naja]|nr:hypothetical protein E2320_004542 [Naja naja]
MLMQKTLKYITFQNDSPFATFKEEIILQGDHGHRDRLLRLLKLLSETAEESWEENELTYKWMDFNMSLNKVNYISVNIYLHYVNCGIQKSSLLNMDFELFDIIFKKEMSVHVVDN